MHPKANELRFVTKNDGCVHVHPSSVNYTVSSNTATLFWEAGLGRVPSARGSQPRSVPQVRHYNSPFLVYHEKVKTSRVFIRDCSMVSVYPLVLFGGGQVNMELQRGAFVISLDDGWIRFSAASHQVRNT